MNSKVRSDSPRENWIVIPLAKDLLSIDDISAGRLIIGLGSGGIGIDATVLGGHQKLDTTMQYTRVSMAKLQEVHARCHPAENKQSRAS